MTVPVPEAVVMDVEGTVGSLSHVREVLFPYARQRLARWVAENWEDGPCRSAAEQVRALTGRPDLDRDGVVEALLAWADADAKVRPLKEVQGLVWAAGYRDGELHGHLYPDVPEALRRWRRQGIARFVFSSGSVDAQRQWFRHADVGDASGLVDGYFDLATAGPKHDPDSYRSIARSIAYDPGRVLFLSDVEEELRAAAAAGWQAVGVRRPGDPRGARIPGCPTVAGLDDPLLPGPSGPRARDAAASH